MPVPTVLPRFAAAVGLDPNPVDVRDPDQARWLEACVWPDEVERFHRLEAAIALARTVGVDLRRGDAVADSAALIAELGRRGHPVLTTSWVMNYLTPDERREFVAALDRAAAEQDVSWVYAENPALCPELPGGEVQGDDPNLPTSLVLVRWRGRSTDRRPARPLPSARALDALGLTQAGQPPDSAAFTWSGTAAGSVRPGGHGHLHEIGDELLVAGDGAAARGRRSWWSPTARPNSRGRRRHRT